MNKDDCDRCGVTFEAIRMDPDYIAPGKGPERDRELDTIIGNIRKASQVGVTRSSHTTGRSFPSGETGKRRPKISRRAAHATE